MLTIMPIFGTRPEAVKLAPVIRELARFPDRVRLRIAVTAQHREMLDQVLHVFDIRPDIDLDIMQHGQSLAGITTRALDGLDRILAEERPDLVLVQGDTVTVFAGALAAFYHKVPVGHVEAGLRTGDRYDPFPEEMMRRLTTVASTLHFAPTEQAKQRLLAEGVPSGQAWVTGNTVIDALLTAAGNVPPCTDSGYREILVTAHRRENLGQPLENVCRGLRTVVESHPDVRVTYAMHRNPAVRAIATSVLGGMDRVRLIEPPDYANFVAMEKAATLIVTDSGGVQEEAPALGVPVLVVRRTTERPEGVEAGTARLIGTEQDDVAREVSRLLDDPDAYAAMAQARNPYGDGRAAERIREIIFAAMPDR